MVAASQGLKQRKLLMEEVAQFQGAALVAQLPSSGMLTTADCVSTGWVLCCVQGRTLCSGT